MPLGDLMHRVEPLPEARYVVFYCADIDDEGVSYYESVALEDAYHPQTILKYVTGMELVASLAAIGRGKGGYWEDQGYEWYAGI